MGCGCKGGRLGGGVRGVGHRPVTTPRMGTLVTPRTLGPTAKRQLARIPSPGLHSAQRREIERKRRLAIMNALGR